MKRLFIILFLNFIFINAYSQQKYNVQFILKEQTITKHDTIYIVGTFNNWDSLSNNNYLMNPVGEGKKAITLSLPAGTIGYKFHRGNWLTVEKHYSGREVEDRIIQVTKDTMLMDSILAWRDMLVSDKRLELINSDDLENQVSIMSGIASTYAFQVEYYNIDSAFHYAQKAIELQQKLISEGKSEVNADQARKLFWAKEIVASLLHSLGNYAKSLELRLENLALAESTGLPEHRVTAISNLVEDFLSMKDYKGVLQYGKEAEKILADLSKYNSNVYEDFNIIWISISTAYYNIGQLDSALIYAQKNADLLVGSQRFVSLAYGESLLGDIYAAMGDNKTALEYYQKALDYAPVYTPKVIAEIRIGIAKVYEKEGNISAALNNARQAMNFFQNNSLEVLTWGESSDFYISEFSPLIADLYKSAGKYDSAYMYLKHSVNLKDSLYNSDRIRQFQTLTFNDASRRQQIEKEKEEAKEQFRTKIKIYGLIGGLGGVLVLTLILLRNNRQKQKANALLKSQKDKVEEALGELKTTQAQLIQSEKMASLGELTAGIAHEIQNPLNFVNNFSEVSGEMIEEVNEEIEGGDLDEAKEILQDLKGNLEKINHHGQRASGIVKSMLDHSRTTAVEKVETDINALCDEYLRLAYHGMRAKDHSFNADFKLNLDPDLPKINVIPQDIGRVLLNLINNAFQACADQSVSAVTDLQGFENLEGQGPKVEVTTKNLGDKIEISVSDNGPGIPDDIKDKIFQPFFTTKPTGQGTGLGLSISYDIITKGHGGKLTVKSEKDIGTEFIIILPLT